MVFLKLKGIDSGFTLIEVLVSMMAMAICLTVIMNLFSGGLKARTRSKDHNAAVELADNKMQEILSNKGYEAGILEGQFENGYSWVVEIKNGQDLQQSSKLWDIWIEIKWMLGKKEKKYMIQTMASDAI